MTISSTNDDDSKVMTLTEGDTKKCASTQNLDRRRQDEGSPRSEPSGNDNDDAVDDDHQHNQYHQNQDKDDDDDDDDDTSKWWQWVRAFMRDLVRVDETQITFVPGMRTATILMIEWFVFGIGNDRSTAFQLGALFVGFVDPSESLSQRLNTMGLTELAVIIVGALLPSLVWDRAWLDFVVGIPVAYLTGISPILGSAALPTAMKFGTALYAINGAVNRNTNGSGGLGLSVLWTFYGASASLLAALLPEMLGNRDAVRTDLFGVWHGIGQNLIRWGHRWITREHFQQQTPIPLATMAVYKTQSTIANDLTEDPKAKEWLLSIVKKADSMRTLSFCLSNGYNQYKQSRDPTNDERNNSFIDFDNEMDDLFVSLGKICNRIAFTLQFPWAVRYTPMLQNRIRKGLENVFVDGSKLKATLIAADDSRWLSTLVDLLLQESEGIVKSVKDGSTWPRYLSIDSLPKRIMSAFPSSINIPQKDELWVIQGYAIRYCIAFSVASIPELFSVGTAAHWFPMTVAFIMGPSESATLLKVLHRIIGTLIGICVGAALTPLFDYPGVLIVLLGLETYAACLYFKANYTLFTVFITSWIFSTSVGAGAEVGRTIVYRCLWTLSAGVLVLLVTYIVPPKNPIDVTSKLVKLCRELKVFAECVLTEYDLRISKRDDPDDSGPAVAVAVALAEATAKTQSAREGATQARISALVSIHDATLVLTPRHETIDPHSIAPTIASDLIDAVFITQFLSLVIVEEKNSTDSLMVGFDDQTFAEIDRLADRLEFLSRESTKAAAAGRRTPASTVNTTRRAPGRPTHSQSGRGPFANAIAAAHKRLDDDFDVPADVVVEEEA